MKNTRREFCIFLMFIFPKANAQSVTIRFQAASREFEHATKVYRSIWQDEGDRIIYSVESLTGLGFSESAIDVVVYEGISLAGSHVSPMMLRASYPTRAKRATLIHELGHRHLARLAAFASGLDSHQILNLVLYDVWADLYGEAFANEQVLNEVKRKGHYDYEAAWLWALSYSKEERKIKFSEIKRRYLRGQQN